MLDDLEYAALGFETFHKNVLAPLAVVESAPLEVAAYQCLEHIRPDEARSRSFEPVSIGWRWGPVWSTSWFLLGGSIPDSMREQPLVLHFSSGTEALLFRDGVPHHGFDPYHRHALLGVVREANIDLLVEAACNRPLGASMFWWEHAEEHERWCEDRPGRLEHAELQVRDPRAERFARSWLFATRLMRTSNARSELAHRLEAGLRRLRSTILGTDPPTIGSTLPEELEALIGAGTKRPTTCVAVGHAHIDTAWLWPLSETRRKCLRTFATQLRNLERFPGFRFLCSQPQQYAFIEEESPPLFAQIAERVREGRWEAAGAMWIEPDANIPSGESLIRQILHGTQYWQDRFGRDAPQTFLYLPDTFGFPASLPQICRLAGLKTFITNKIAWSETNRFPHVTFNWRGIDGSEVLTHLTPGHNYNSSIVPQDFVDAEERLLELDGTRCMEWLQPYGWGDGGGGPDEEQILNGELAELAGGMPHVKQCSATEFCERLHEAFTRSDEPRVWDGELYLELHRGTYTTHARLKASNRRAERELREIEALVVAPDLGDADAVEKVRPWLDTTWKTVLLNQFHDILPGSSIPAVYEDAHRAMDSVHVDCAHQIDEGLRRIEGRIDTRGLERPLLVWNPASSLRSAVVDTDVGPRLIRDVPPLGVRVIDLAADVETPHPVIARERSLANGLVEFDLDDAGRVRRLASIESSVEFEDPLNTLVLHADRPRRWEAWDLDRDYVDQRQAQVGAAASIRLLEDHPERGVIEVERPIGRASRIRQRYVLESNARVVRVETHLEWHEDHMLLRAEFAPNIRARFATYGIQFGSIERPTHANTSWERAAFEVPGHLWMDLSEPGRGLAVIDDGSRFGRSCRGNTLGLSLVRATTFPDPSADRGVHEFAYGLMPHDGEWRRAAVDEEAEAFGARMRAVPAPAGASGPLRDGWSVLPIECSGTAVEIAACKPLEAGEGLVVRLVERRGARGVARFTLPDGVENATLVDLREEPLESPDLVRSGRCIEIRFDPYRIHTLLLR